MGCNNTNVKDDEVPKNLNANKVEEKNSKEENEHGENSNNSKNKKNLDEESSRLDDDDDNDENMNKNQKFDPNRSISEENKGILNLYNGTIKRPEVCIVPNTVIFDPKGPEDKKPPDINKLREKKD